MVGCDTAYAVRRRGDQGTRRRNGTSAALGSVRRVVSGSTSARASGKDARGGLSGTARERDALIYLVRHGETVWNTEKRRQGRKDSPLTARGLAQAARNGERLRRLIGSGGPASIVSSPLPRAWQTACILAETMGQDPRGIVLEPSLMECSFGAWEGLTNDEIRLGFAAGWEARSRDRWNTAPEGGESYADVHGRVSRWYAAARLTSPTILVCHGLTSRVFRGIYAALPQAEIFGLPETQDGVFALHEGRIALIED